MFILLASSTYLNILVMRVHDLREQIYVIFESGTEFVNHLAVRPIEWFPSILQWRMNI